MLKVLLKKQIMQTYAAFYRSGKRGKNRSKTGIIGYALLMLYVIGIFAYLFFNAAKLLCEPLVKGEIAWFYFMLFGMMTVCMGVVGSIFMTQSQMYQAKDNEMLLAMPIPPAVLLLARMLSLFLQTFFFSALVFVPVLLVYWLTVGITAGNLICGILLLLLLIILAQILSCILGWLVALASSRLKNKNIVTVILSLVFLGIYLYLYTGMNRILSKILENSQELAVSVKEKLYFLYLIGVSGTGDIKAVLFLLFITCLLFAIVYVLLSKSFLIITTTNRGSAKREYRQKEMTVSSMQNALFRKEISRFFGTAVYMLNCGLGTIFLAAACVLMVIKRDYLLKMMGMLYPGMEKMLPLLLLAAICAVSCMNAITAPSISLEGNTLWNLQVLPIPMQSVLVSKIKLHMAMTGIPAFICALVVDFIFDSSWIIKLLLPMIAAAYIFLMAELGLFFNLRHPSLNWTSETYAVKQSLSVILTLAVGMAILASVCIFYVVFMGKINDAAYLAAVLVVVLLISCILWKWLMQKGSKILEIIGDMEK